MARSLADLRRVALMAIDAKAREVALHWYRGAADNSAVDTGALRSNWTVGVTLPPTACRGGTSDPMPDIIAAIRPGVFTTGASTIFLANNLPYAVVVEYGLYPKPPRDPINGKTMNGYSKKAPQGMVRLALQNTIRRYS